MNFPDNIILWNNIELEDLTNEQIKDQIGLEETEASFILDNKKGGNPLKNIRYEQKQIHGILENREKIILNETTFKNIEIKDNYWNDIQKSILHAIRVKNKKAEKYITKETGLIINIAHKLVPIIIEKSSEKRLLISEKETTDFCIQFINELEELTNNNHETFENLSFVLIYFSFFTENEPYTYSITLPCFYKRNYKIITYNKNIEKKEYKIESLLNKNKDDILKILVNVDKLEQ